MISITAWRSGDPLPHALLQRNAAQQNDAGPVARAIVEDVRSRGDEAVVAYTRQFDCPNFAAEQLIVSPSEVDAAVADVGPELMENLRLAADNIRTFHELQRQRTWLFMEDGVILGQMMTPIEAVGHYVPGGRAAYPSSLLMSAIPAQVAGVARRVLITPPQKDGRVFAPTLAAARVAGITEIYRAGGAQAIAALAYGTATIAPVHKVVGPGNAYVAAAKREVYGVVGIDSIAGPSEVLIIADESARPSFVAADMLAQAEHDPLAAAVLVTVSRALASGVQAELSRQLETLPTREAAEASLRSFGAILLVSSLQEAMAASNLFAPEHLELAVDAPLQLLPLVRQAGAVFLGHHTPEPVGDYYAGPSHILPTFGTARFSSPVTVDDFVKKTSVVAYDQPALARSAARIAALAHSEGLIAHERSITIRGEGL